MRRSPFGDLLAQWRKALGRCSREHHRREEFAPHRALAECTGIDGDHAIGKASLLSDRVDLHELLPDARLDRAIALQFPFELKRQRTDDAGNDDRQALSDDGHADQALFVLLEALQVAIAKLPPETEKPVPQPVLLEFQLARHRQIVLRELAQVVSCSTVEEIDVLEPLVELELAGLIDRIQPVGDFLERLGGIVRRQRIDDLTRLPGVRHRMVDLTPQPLDCHSLPWIRRDATYELPRSGL